MPLEYSTRIIDLFWVFQDQILYDALIHLLEISQYKIMKMDYEGILSYIRSDIVKENILEYGLDYCLPY